jgi:hypothetical protein
MAGMGDHSAASRTDVDDADGKGRLPVWAWVIGLIAGAAAIEIWATWLGIGSLSGFPVLVLGRLARIPTDWSLAVGMEAYAGFALWVWLSGAKGKNSRNFACGSAVGALLLSLVVQVSYHLMLASGDHRAPDWLVGFVSALPLIVLTLAAILVHLMHLDAEAARTVVRRAQETDERTLLREKLAGARQAHEDAVAALSADLKTARDAARNEAAVRAETAQLLDGVRAELQAARAERTRAEDARQDAVRQREEDVSAARREIDATRAQLDQARTNAAMRPVIEADRDRARADASAQQTARLAAEAAHADAARALARAHARTEELQRTLAEAEARERTDAHDEDLTRLSPAQAKAKAFEKLDEDESLTGEALAAKFGLKARWGQMRKSEWLSLRSDGAEGLRAVGES